MQKSAWLISGLVVGIFLFFLAILGLDVLYAIAEEEVRLSRP